MIESHTPDGIAAAVALPPARELPPRQGFFALACSVLMAIQLLMAIHVVREDAEKHLLDITNAMGGLVTGYLVFTGMVALVGGIRLLRSLKARRFARRHLSEPWLWDRPWKTELEDPRLTLTSLLRPVPVFVLFGGFVAAVIIGGIWGLLFRFDGAARILGVLVFGGMGAFSLESVWRGILSPYVQRWKRRRRFGSLRLRVHEIPMALGTSTQVELLSLRDLPELTQLQATLRCLRGREETFGSDKTERTVTYKACEYEHVQELHVERLGPEHPVVIRLELPFMTPESWTWARGPQWVYWDLQLTTEGPEPRLNSHFSLPIYLVPTVRDTTSAGS